MIWRNAAYSARIAASDLAGDAPLDEPRATNRALAAPFRAELARLFPDG
ncbi:hypothetical protein [uncultured Enterovirga sp.]